MNARVITRRVGSRPSLRRLLADPVRQRLDGHVLLARHVVSEPEVDLGVRTHQIVRDRQ